MSINIDPRIFCSCQDTTGNLGINQGRTGNSLITIIILILIVYLCGGRVFGGYGNYPGYGGFSPYGYTPKPKKYRYPDDYIIVYEPDI